MDTANYSDNFISHDVIEKLDATHLCYPALKAITVCSGLDGQCYLDYEICDLKILFHSYDGECHSISLPMRVNRKRDIDILFSRETVNKYDFWTLTPFAFGISPELSAENKRKSDARRREFYRKEALNKLDPMYQHKCTRRMIALGAEPYTAAVESLAPHYDKLKLLFAALSSGEMPKANGVNFQKSYLFTVSRLNNMSMSLFRLTLMGRLMLWHSPS